MGRNGAGKSTLSKLICGFEAPGSGSILPRRAGSSTERHHPPAGPGRIGYVMQNPNQMISKTMIYDEVALGLVQRSGLTEAQIRAKVEQTLKNLRALPLPELAGVGALSFGQKKRVTIASVLALDPDAHPAGRAYGRARISATTPTSWSSCGG